MKLGLTYHTLVKFDRARETYSEAFALRQRPQLGLPAATVPPAPHPFRAHFAEPTTLDPGLWTSFYSIYVPGLFSGLVDVDPDMTVVPDVAASWEILDGGRTYLFHLRDDVHWSDGLPVTAGDFECGWRRFLRPPTPASAAAWLFDVKGAQGFHQGLVSSSDHLGIRALDDATLMVDLTEPAGHFLYVLLHPALAPIPRHVVEVHGGDWALPQNLVTNGPFRLSAWEPRERLILDRDPTHHRSVRGNVDRVQWLACPTWPVPDEWTARLVGAYERDEVDWLHLAMIAPEEHDRICQRFAPDHLTTPALNTSFIEFDVTRPPFDDVRMRQAFAFALDRDELDSMLFRGRHEPATGGIVPPAVPGHSAAIGLQYDADQARQLISEAGYHGGRGLPTLHAVAAHGFTIADHIAAHWHQVLGVDVVWHHMDGQLFSERWSGMGQAASRLWEPAPHLWLTSRNATVPDPFPFLRPRSRRAYSGWHDEAFESLALRAGRTADRKDRLELYRQADRIIIEQAAVLPVCYSDMGALAKPWVRPSLWNTVRYWGTQDFIIEPH